MTQPWPGDTVRIAHPDSQCYGMEGIVEAMWLGYAPGILYEIRVPEKGWLVELYAKHVVFVKLDPRVEEVERG